MKKTRILALAVVVAVMLMGAGYAAWTDRLTISNTVGTGELNVKFTEASLQGVEADTVYIQPSAAFADKNVTLTVGNLYPGAAAKFNGKFVNNGTIPAVINKVDFNFDDANGPDGKTALTDDQKQSLLVNGKVVQYRGETVINSYTIPGNRKLVDLRNDLNNIMPGWRLEKDDIVAFEDVTLTLDPNAGDEFENKFVKFSIGMDFKQHNQ